MKYLLILMAFLLSCKQGRQENTQVTFKENTIKINSSTVIQEKYIIKKDSLLGKINGTKIVYDYASYYHEYGNRGDYLTINTISKQRKNEIYTEQLYYGLNEVKLVYFYNQPFIYISIQDAKNNYGNFYSINPNTFKLTQIRDTIYKNTAEQINIPNYKEEEWEYRGADVEFDGKTISSYIFYRKKDGSGESYLSKATYKMSKDEKGNFILHCTDIKIEETEK